MEKVLHYLELKNQYYEKFYQITSTFIEKADRDNWDDLEYLVDNRERILHIIRYFDHKIGLRMKDAPIQNETISLYGDRVSALLARRKNLANLIVTTDRDLISRLDEVKSETIKELKQSMDTTRKVGSYSEKPPNKQMRRGSS